MRQNALVRTLLATLTGNLFLVFGSFFFGSLAILLGWLPPRGNLMFWSARMWSRLLLRCAFIPVSTRFEATLDASARYIYMANHQSLFDIPVLIATLPGQTRFLAKQSLFRIPVFGWALAVGGFIPVNREDRSRARDVFTSAVDRLRVGNSILLFPEETRSVDGNLLPFQRGGFLLALKSGLAIVPVGIRGTLEVQRKGSFAIRPQRIAVHYGAPISVAGCDLKQRKELATAVRARVAELAGLSVD
jgi:1-acyl-sn-glycerol-3-phosphate acyltransferase